MSWDGSGVEGRSGLSVRLLGPLEVRIDGRAVNLTAGRLRTLLAALAVAAGQTVSVNRLATAVWWEDQPVDAKRGLQVYVTRLRRILGSTTVGTRPEGYVLHADADDVDALRFLRLVDSAFREREPVLQQPLLAQALALWRGAPFEDVPSPWLDESEAPRLVERYLTAVERRIDLDIAEGRYEALVGELTKLTAHHPLRESLWARMLIVLDRCGRRAEALVRYETIRRHIADELGADPGSELQRLHADLLAGDALAHPYPVAPDDPARPTPRQLPADIDAFTGRVRYLKELDNLTSDTGTAVTVIDGAAGVGKTALAIHWAHLVHDRFPDGQLYVNLRGYDASGAAMEPGEVLRGFLAAIGVPQHRIPVDAQALSGLYRSLLTGKKMLVVLDNARDEAQVRPLLPGGTTCATIVTSRSELTGLIAADGAKPVNLGLLPFNESRDLLAGRLGGHRLATQPQALDEIVDRCAGLPLAVTIVAARAVTHPTFPLTALAAELRDREGTLDAFTVGDPATDVRTVFSWSYRALNPAAARLLRLLSHHPGPDVTAAAAASVAAEPVRQVHRSLIELTRTNLVTEPVPGRYVLHDLLRAYAAERSEREDPEPDRRAALYRTLDHYLRTAYAGSRLLDPHNGPVPLPPSQPGVTVEHLADQQQALTWFTAEYPVLITAQRRASTDAYTCPLAIVMWTYLERQGRWHDLVGTETAALEAALRIGDRPVLIAAHHGLGRVYAELRRYAEAHRELQCGIELAGETGDQTAEAGIHRTRAWVYDEQRRPDDALAHYQLALQLYRKADDRVGHARALSGIGLQHVRLGNPKRGFGYGQRALRVQQQVQDRRGAATTIQSIGLAYHQLGNHLQAAACFRRTIELFREAGHRYGEADALIHLGDVQLAAGEADEAHAAWRAALTILDELGHPNTDVLRAKLGF
jgi:DNA-binding SARP family transcriptional activator/tetratricopeptide (TPR) repeat protein